MQDLRHATLLSFLALYLTACSSDGDINVFSVQRDLELGQQTNREIVSHPEEFPILDPKRHAASYAYVQGMVDEIVEKGKVPYADVFPYSVTLIDSGVENAFATPGGYIYVYTGLVETLDSGDQLAGVLAHEIAHAARRHSTDQLTKQYGLSTLIGLLTGGENPGLLAQVAGTLLNLRFGRSDEAQADDSSVDYLCNTRFAANGAAGFFEKIQDGPNPPEFLSSHPSPRNRVSDINARAAEEACGTETADVEEFRAFRDNLGR